MLLDRLLRVLGVCPGCSDPARDEGTTALHDVYDALHCCPAVPTGAFPAEDSTGPPVTSFEVPIWKFCQPPRRQVDFVAVV